MKRNAIRLSRALYWIFSIGLVAAPLATVYFFWKLDWVLAHMGASAVLTSPAAQDFAPGPVTALTQWLGFAVAAVPTAITCAMLYNLAVLFGGYARGEVFTLGSVRRIRRVGILLLVREALSPVIDAAMTIVLTLSNPPGQRMV